MRYDVAVIGAGICGTSIARELSRYDLRIALLEKTNDIANGATKANSGIVHAGYDPDTGTLSAQLNVAANPVFETLCAELDVPFKRIGSLVLGFDTDDQAILNHLLQQGQRNGVTGLQLLGREAVLELEPQLNHAVQSALWAPTAGIVGPWELAIALAENAIQNGVQLFLNCPVLRIIKDQSGFILVTPQGELQATDVINCAGLFADQVSSLLAAPGFGITPRRGEYFLLDRSADGLIRHVLFQTPGEFGKGVLMAPTVHGNIIIGPNSEQIDDREGTETTLAGLAYVRQAALRAVPAIPFNLNITNFAGLRAVATGGDFIIRVAPHAPRLIEVAGIKSPGLSAAPAIAAMVVRLLQEQQPELRRRTDFNPHRRPVVRFDRLQAADRQRLVTADPQSARIICRCENVTEAEVIDAIHRPAGARTLDGVKKRVRPGSGRCQGGFCMPRVIEILARELHCRPEEIVKDDPGAYILTGPTRKS